MKESMDIPILDLERLEKLDRRIRRLNNLMNGRQEGTNKYFEYRRTLKKKTHERHMLLWKYFNSLVDYCQAKNIPMDIQSMTKHRVVDIRDTTLVKIVTNNFNLIEIIIKKKETK